MINFIRLQGNQLFTSLLGKKNYDTGKRFENIDVSNISGADMTDYQTQDVSVNNSILHDLRGDNQAQYMKQNSSPFKGFSTEKKAKPVMATAEKQPISKHLDSTKKGVLLPKGSHLRYASYGEINPMMEN